VRRASSPPTRRPQPLQHGREVDRDHDEARTREDRPDDHAGKRDRAGHEAGERVVRDAGAVSEDRARGPPPRVHGRERVERERERDRERDRGGHEAEREARDSPGEHERDVGDAVEDRAVAGRAAGAPRERSVHVVARRRQHEHDRREKRVRRRVGQDQREHAGEDEAGERERVRDEAASAWHPR